MRLLKETIPVRLSKQNHEWLKKETKEFEKTIGGGKWSLDDGFSELKKILKTIKEDLK